MHAEGMPSVRGIADSPDKGLPVQAERICIGMKSKVASKRRHRDATSAQVMLSQIVR